MATTPFMGLTAPTVSVTPGPLWASQVNADLFLLDGHDHSNSKGVSITPAGMLINSDLTFNNNNGIQFRSVRFTAQITPFSGAADIGCLSVSGVDLWYNDILGNKIRLTQSGGVAGASGTITGLPSGTASVSFLGVTYTFLSATATPAIMSVGP